MAKAEWKSGTPRGHGQAEAAWIHQAPLGPKARAAPRPAAGAAVEGSDAAPADGNSRPAPAYSWLKKERTPLYPGPGTPGEVHAGRR